jgi:hypothetical protein
MSLRKHQKGVSFHLFVIVIAVIASLIVGVGYWSGFLGVSSPTDTENLTIVATQPTQLGFNITISNSGTNDAKLEYLIVNGTTYYPSTIIPYDDAVDVNVYLINAPITNDSTFEIRLHTQAGNDFAQTIHVKKSHPSHLETIEITTADASLWSNYAGWTLTLTMHNTGAVDTTIDNIFINSKLLSAWPGIIVQGEGTAVNIPLEIGNEATIHLDITAATSGLHMGVLLDVKLHTSLGNEYPIFIRLP